MAPTGALTPSSIAAQPCWDRALTRRDWVHRCPGHAAASFPEQDPGVRAALPCHCPTPSGHGGPAAGRQRPGDSPGAGQGEGAAQTQEQGLKGASKS